MKNDSNLIKDVEKLRQEVELTKRKKIFYDNLKKRVPLFGISISIIFFILFLIFEMNLLAIIGIFYLAIAILYPLTNIGKSVELEIDALQSEISLRSTGTDAIEERAERLFKSHEIDLKRYYDLALKQNNSIFLTGIFCLILGFVIIGITIYEIRYFKVTRVHSFNHEVLISIIGCVSSIMTNFIAVVYLKMYSDTLTSFTSFHQKLVSTNHLHFANFLSSKIDDPIKKNDTLKSLCEKIIDNLNKE